MKPFPGVMLMLALVSSASRAGSPRGAFEYLSPLPGSALVSPHTNIILRPPPDIDAQRLVGVSHITVSGTRSGIAGGRATLSDDGRTILFTPDASFRAGETVTVDIRPAREGQGAALRYAYSFRIAENRPAARAVPDVPESAVGRWNRGTSAASLPDSVPADFPSITVTVSNNPSPGYIFLSNMTMGSGALNSPYVIILDNAGKPVFSRRATGECTDFKVQPNGLLTYMDGTLKCFIVMDSTYAVVDTIRCGNGYPTNWHELRMLPNGHVLLLGDDPETVGMDTVVTGGYHFADVQGIVIQELDRSRNVVFQWRTFDHFKITDATHEDLTSSFIDYVHANAIEPDTDGNLLLSCRHMDEITKINRQTGEIIWRMGGKNNQFTFVNDTLRFMHQHAIRRLPNGDVSLFDNGDFRFPLVSRGVEYRLDEQAKTATQVWEFRRTPIVYAAAMGYVQRLPNGNSMIGWGSTSPAVTEVKPDGSVALELTLPTGIYSYRVYRFPWKTVTSAASQRSAFPQSFTLDQNYPNPFNPSTTIGYRIPGAGYVNLRVTDLLGRTVRTLVSGRQEAGFHTATLDGSVLSSGVYFSRLETHAGVAVRRMLLVR